MNRRLYPAVERDLLLAFMRVEDVLVEFQVTFGQVSRSCVLLESHLDRIPFTPAVGSTAAEVEMLLDPEAKTTVLILYVVAGTLCSELFTEPIQQRSQVLLG